LREFGAECFENSALLHVVQGRSKTIERALRCARSHFVAHQASPFGGDCARKGVPFSRQVRNPARGGVREQELAGAGTIERIQQIMLLLREFVVRTHESADARLRYLRRHLQEARETQ
jgi:hypothetical protein